MRHLPWLALVLVLLAPRGQAVPGRVRASRVVLDRARTMPDGIVLWPSDHYGVLAEIEVFGTGTAPPTAQHEEKEARPLPGAERLADE